MSASVVALLEPEAGALDAPEPAEPDIAPEPLAPPLDCLGESLEDGVDGVVLVAPDEDEAAPEGEDGTLEGALDGALEGELAEPEVDEEPAPEVRRPASSPQAARPSARLTATANVERFI